MSDQICVYIHLKSYFPKRVKRHSRIWACNANAKFKNCVFGKEFFTYVYIPRYVHIYEEPFSKTWSPNLALALQHWFLDWRLIRFGKELFIYIYIYIFINLVTHIYMSDIYICVCVWMTHIYIDMNMILIYIYIHIYEELFSKTWSPNLALKHRFLN